MPVYYDSSLISPAPFVSISKDYVRGSDGKKIGATYSITLEGTFLAHKGSPNKTGTFTSIPGLGGSYEEPANDSVEQDELQYALFNKASALRKAFSRDGRRLDLLTWKKDGSGNYTIGYYCFPRVMSVSIDDNRYIEPMPYTVTLEVDEIFHTSDLSSTLGLEDYKNANLNITTEESENFTEKFHIRGNHRIYLSDASESWSIAETEPNSAITDFGLPASPVSDGGAAKQSIVYEVTHSVSATGKRAFGPVQEGSITPGGLIRDAWEMLKFGFSIESAFHLEPTVMTQKTMLAMKSWLEIQTVKLRVLEEIGKILQPLEIMIGEEFYLGLKEHQSNQTRRLFILQLTWFALKT